MRNLRRAVALTSGLALVVSLPVLATPATASSSTPASTITSAIAAARTAAESAVASASAAAPPKLTIFTYRTFIANKFVGTRDTQACLLRLRADRKFGGDNRSYSTGLNANYRTNMTVGIDWVNKKSYTAKSVGATKLYDKNGKYLGQKKASTSGMKFGKVTISGGKATFTLDHSGGNPYCSKLPAKIRYEVKVELRRDGNWRIISGYRRKVPNHEAFVRHNSVSGKAYWLFKKGNSGFKCLVAAACKTESLGGLKGKVG